MAGLTGKNSITSKQFNRGLILQLIATQTCRTRIELSKMTGLAKMTVTNIISEFIQQNLVVECEEELTEVCGRNPILLKISEKAPKVIGLLIFRDRIEAVVCTLTMEILATESIMFDNLTVEQLYADCFCVIDRLLDKEKNILGIGVASIGPVDIRKGMIVNPPRFYGIENVNVVDVLKERYAMPVFFDHDNNSAALAEKLFGVGKNVEDFIFLGISNGIGSGIISNGEVYHSNRGFAPEIGHVSIDRKGLVCACGNRGCLEMYASTYVILEKLKKSTGLDVEFAQFCSMPENQETEQIFEEMLQDVSTALVSSVNVLQPEMIVLGHDCIDWAERHVLCLEKLINEKKMVHDEKKITVRKAYFKKNAQLAGAAVNVVNQVFKGELLFESRK
ncbi:MAG: ROK family protein [Oliverpabstia sp.]